MNKKHFDYIINECIKQVLSEGDLIGDKPLSTKPYINAWKLLYNFCDNLKENMNTTIKGKNGHISQQDVKDVFSYVDMTLNNIKTTFPF